MCLQLFIAALYTTPPPPPWRSRRHAHSECNLDFFAQIHLQKTQMNRKDQRFRIMNEILAGMKVCFVRKQIFDIFPPANIIFEAFLM